MWANIVFCNYSLMPFKPQEQALLETDSCVDTFFPTSNLPVFPPDGLECAFLSPLGLEF